MLPFMGRAFVTQRRYAADDIVYARFGGIRRDACSTFAPATREQRERDA
jgi:hypothetical protein